MSAGGLGGDLEGRAVGLAQDVSRLAGCGGAERVREYLEGGCEQLQVGMARWQEVMGRKL